MMGGQGRRKCVRSPEEEMEKSEAIQKTRRIISLLRKDIKEQFGIDAMVSENYNVSLATVMFYLTKECKINMTITCDFEEEALQAEFGRQLIFQIRMNTLTSEVVSTLLPVLKHYHISFEAFSDVWWWRLEKDVPTTLFKTIETWKECAKSGKNQPFTEAMERKLRVVQERQCENHMDLFQIFVSVEKSLDFVSQERESLTLINGKGYKYLEICFTKTERFLYYLGNQRAGFRELFSRLWSREVTLFLEAIQWLQLPELMGQVLLYWVLLICN